MDKDDLKKQLRDALTEPEKPKSKRPIFIFITIISLIILGGILTTTFSQFQLDPGINNELSGKIFSPAPGSLTGNQVKVTGQTTNLEPGQYVWLAVDKPNLGICWPKAPRIKQNCKFSTTIYEGGPKEPYTLSLYVVSKTVNDHWQEWLDAGRIGGLTMPPDKRRLDSVRLTLGK